MQATGIRAYAGVPVRREDGSLIGTLCCLSREPQPQLGERDLRYLDVLARMAAKRLAAIDSAQERRRAEVEAAAGQALLAALNARENYTAEHSEAVLGLALEVASEMGLAAEEATSVGQVALLHDIGKVGVPDAILRKPGGLTAPEWEVMREHPAIGAQIVSAIGSLSHLAPAVRAEHERWDGGGYPDGLAGENVPLASRICFVCDAWHAMTSDRPYRRALSADQARAELRRNAGTQFCPVTVSALERVLDRGAPAGEAPQPLDTPDRAAARAPRPAARGGAAGADHDLEHGRRRAPLRGRARHRRRGGPPRPARRRRLDLALGARARQHADADQRRASSTRGRSAGRSRRRGRSPTLDRTLVTEARPYVIALDHVALPDEERRFLEQIGRGSALAAPIRSGGRVWGVLEAYSAVDAPPFTDAHVRFAEALCAQVATAIGRAQLFSRLEDLAYRDPLTGLPNRRALDERMEDAVAAAQRAGQRPRARLLRPRRPQGRQRPAGPRGGRPRAGRGGPGAGRGGRGVPGLDDLPARRRRVLRADGGPWRRRRAASWPATPRTGWWRARRGR